MLLTGKFIIEAVQLIMRDVLFGKKSDINMLKKLNLCRI